MNSRMRRTAATGLALWSMMAIAALAQRRSPALISPDTSDEDGRVATGCPTFSWTLVAEATGYELRIYDARPPEEIPASSAAPRLRKAFPDGATSWTPALRECLPPGRYGWAVAALVGEGEPRWSQPGLFEVAARPPRTPAAPERRAAAPLVLTGSPSSSAQAWSSPDSNRKHVSDEAYTPPLCGSGKFADVPAGSSFCRWIEQLDRDGIMTSCDGGSNFCPKNPVTREQLAAIVGKATRGTPTWHPAEGSNWLAPPAANVVTTVDDVGDVGQYSSITIGVDGLPIISYYDNTVEALKVAHCNDVACAAPATITTVDNNGNLGGYSSITIGSDGLPIISYWDTTVDLENGIRREALKVAHCNDVACSGQDETLTFVHDPETNNVGLYTSIAIGMDGMPIIAYFDATAHALLIAYCHDPACATPATIKTLDPSGVAAANISLAISHTGAPTISYRSSEGLKAAICFGANCGASQANLITSNASEGGTAITIGVDGMPIIAFRGDSAFHDDLKVVHCNDWGCGGQNEAIRNLGVNFEFGVTPTIAIGVDGQPIIGADTFPGLLAVVHCNDPACANGFESIGVPDEFGAQFPSMTVGVDGLPIISYYHAATGALKVAHCANVFCVPYVRRR